MIGKASLTYPRRVRGQPCPGSGETAVTLLVDS